MIFFIHEPKQARYTKVISQAKPKAEDDNKNF